MKFTITYLLLLMVELTDAQSSIQGRVVDRQTQQPLAGVSIFLSNTTKGTSTNGKGEFVLNNVGIGKCELVITSVNYENNVVQLRVNKAIEAVTVTLTPKVTVLQEVVVEPFERDGWESWGDCFRSYLVGSDDLSKRCVLENPDAVKFQFNSKTNKLRAFTNEKLIFVNTELGYRIIYVLSNFEVDFNRSTFSIKGYPLFEELKAKNEKEKARWDKLRSEVYRGSLRHFMRSLYANQLSKEGFVISKMKFISHQEASRVRNILKSLRRQEDPLGGSHSDVDKDSMDYYVKVKNMALGDTALILENHIPGDSVLSKAEDPNAKSLYFDGYLQVVFLRKKVPTEYARTLPLNERNEFIESYLNLAFGVPISIYPNGNYFNGLDLLVVGYWAWSEKISTMLPSDYSDNK